MKSRILLLSLSVLIIGCAAQKRVGVIDFNPIYEWKPTMRVFALPFSDSTLESQTYRIEYKLAKLARLAGNRADLAFVADPDSAEVLMQVRYQIDTVSYVVPSSSYGGSFSSSYYNKLVKNFVSFGSGWSVTTPSYEERAYYITIQLWIVEKSLSTDSDHQENPTRMVARSSGRLEYYDHNMLTYDLFEDCIKIIPGTDKKFNDRVPKLGLYLPNNWLGGIKTSGNELSEKGYWSSPSGPFREDDIIYEINGQRVYDYFDYKAIMLSLTRKDKSCKVKYNRQGKLKEVEVDLK
jgi:hypothetical protein